MTHLKRHIFTVTRCHAQVDTTFSWWHPSWHPSWSSSNQHAVWYSMDTQRNRIQHNTTGLHCPECLPERLCATAAENKWNISIQTTVNATECKILSCPFHQAGELSLINQHHSAPVHWPTVLQKVQKAKFSGRVTSEGTACTASQVRWKWESVCLVKHTETGSVWRSTRRQDHSGPLGHLHKWFLPANHLRSSSQSDCQTYYSTPKEC